MGEKAASDRHLMDIERDIDIKEICKTFKKDKDVLSFLEEVREIRQPDVSCV